MKNISYEKTLNKIRTTTEKFFVKRNFEGHSGSVKNILLSKDEKTLYSFSKDNTII